MYMAPLWVARRATCCAFHRKLELTEGMDNNLLPPPVDCRKQNGNFGSFAMGSLNTERISFSTCSSVIDDVRCNFPVNPWRPSSARYRPRGNESVFPLALLLLLCGMQTMSRSQVFSVFGFFLLPPL